MLWLELRENLVDRDSIIMAHTMFSPSIHTVFVPRAFRGWEVGNQGQKAVREGKMDGAARSSPLLPPRQPFQKQQQQPPTPEWRSWHPEGHGCMWREVEVCGHGQNESPNEPVLLVPYSIWLLQQIEMCNWVNWLQWLLQVPTFLLRYWRSQTCYCHGKCIQGSL